MPKKKRSKFKYNFRKYCVIPLKILRIAIVDTIRQDGIEHAGYLAFLSILSLFPSIIFLISIAQFFGAFEDGINFINTVIASTPKDMSEALAPRITEILSGPPQSLLTIAIIGVIWTASSSVEGCRTILNRAYRVALPPPYIWRRFISILQFFAIILIIIVSIFVFVIVPNLFHEIDLKVFNSNFDFHSKNIRNTSILLLLTCSTSILYFALPNVKQKLSQTIPGSILTVILWIILAKIFIIYIEDFQQFSLIYGSLAGFIASLIFFYLISLAFILGAEFNYHFHRTYTIFLKKPNNNHE
jgi:membrane protein